MKPPLLNSLVAGLMIMLLLGCGVAARSDVEPSIPRLNRVDPVFVATVLVDGASPDYLAYGFSKDSEEGACFGKALGGGTLTGDVEWPAFERRSDGGPYEWEFCLHVGDRWYRGWRGMDPGPGSAIELSCKVSPAPSVADSRVCDLVGVRPRLHTTPSPECLRGWARRLALSEKASKCSADSQCFHYPCSCNAVGTNEASEQLIELDQTIGVRCGWPAYSYCGPTETICVDGVCQVRGVTRR